REPSIGQAANGGGAAWDGPCAAAAELEEPPPPVRVRQRVAEPPLEAQRDREAEMPFEDHGGVRRSPAEGEALLAQASRHRQPGLERVDATQSEQHRHEPPGIAQPSTE